MIFMPSADEAKIVRGKDGEMKLENFYTPLAEAKKEIQRRWKDKELRKKVDKFLGGDVPKFLKGEPKVYLARHLNTPDKEFSRFLELSKKLKLSPICPELLSDKFSAKNSDKYYLGKLFFHDGNGKNGGDKISTLRIIDFCSSEGKKISSLKTIWGESLIDFHHAILKASFPEIKGRYPDLSSWIAKKKKGLGDFYYNFLPFFLCNAVLLESFIVEEEKEIIQDFIIPQFNKVWQEFEVKPLVVRLLPPKKESDRIWCCQPESVKKLLRTMVIL